MNNTLLKIVVPLALIGISVGGFMFVNANVAEEPDKEAVDTRPTVKVETILAQDHQVMITSFGEVRALENTMLAAQVSGEVMSWHENFVPGGLIVRGDVLFSIEKDTYEAALLQAEAELSNAQALLIEEQARAKVAKQEAKNLPKKSVSDLYLRKPQVLSAEASVKSAQARIKIAQRDLDNCDIRAPYDALVITRDIGVGQYVNQGATVAEISNIENAEIVFPIAGFDREFLPADIRGAEALIINKGLNTFTRNGKIARDLGVIDSETRMSQLIIRIEDPYSLKSEMPVLKFGSYVEVNFAGTTLQQSYKLPQDLVTNKTIWIVNAEQQLEPRKVVVLREEDEYFIIGEGITEQDKLVTTIPEYPQKGMQVKIADTSNDIVAQK
jgi:multidrug efflux system membrane fusion protein